MWISDYITVLNSLPLQNVLKTLEKYERGETDNSYLPLMGAWEDTLQGKEKSQYQIAKELKKQYPGIQKLLLKLKEKGLVAKILTSEKGKRDSIIYGWTFKAGILFPEFAPIEVISGIFRRVFGEWNECIRFFSLYIGCDKIEARGILLFLCWLRRKFLRWVRDELFLPRSEKGDNLLKLGNYKYWRKIGIQYLIREYFLYISDDVEIYFAENFKDIPDKSFDNVESILHGLDKVLQYAETILLKRELKRKHSYLIRNNP
jgi:hypothetical protein